MQKGCGGVWFDKGEYKKVDEKHEFPNLEVLEYEPQDGTVINELGRKCPHCNKLMFNRPSSIKNEVYIDECEYCGGIWVDAGELKKIREMFETDEHRKEAAKNYVAGSSKRFIRKTGLVTYIGERDIDCPACSKPLEKIDMGDFNLDVCTKKCAGIWFDIGEFEKIDEKHEYQSSEVLKYKPKPDIKIKEGLKECPLCKVSMKKYFITPRRLIEAEICETCKGIWLDGGELVAIRNMHENAQEREKELTTFFEKTSDEILETEFENKTQDDKMYQSSSKMLKILGIDEGILRKIFFGG